MNYNKVILIGRLVREPETVMLPSGSQVSNLVIAYNRSYKDQSGQWKEESHFFDVKVFGKLVERVIPQLGKGDLILVEGRLHQDKWLDKESGEPKSKIRIVAFDIKLLSKPSPKSSELTKTEDVSQGEDFDFDLEKELGLMEEEPEGNNKKKEKGEGPDDLDEFFF